MLSKVEAAKAKRKHSEEIEEPSKIIIIDEGSYDISQKLAGIPSKVIGQVAMGEISPGEAAANFIQAGSSVQTKPRT